MIVLGANALGLELAQIFTRAGTNVTVLELLPRIAPFEDEEISLALAGYLAAEGMDLATGYETKSVAKRDGRYRLTGVLPDGSERSFAAEQLLVATGRRPNTAGRRRRLVTGIARGVRHLEEGLLGDVLWLEMGDQ